MVCAVAFPATQRRAGEAGKAIRRVCRSAATLRHRVKGRPESRLPFNPADIFPAT